MAQSRLMRSETTPRFGNLNVMSACESFTETMEAESFFVSSPPFNISSFHVFSRLMKIVLRCQNQDVFRKCAFGGPQLPQKTYRGDNRPKYHAASPANCFFLTDMPRQVAAESVNRDQRDFLDTGASVQTGW